MVTPAAKREAVKHLQAHFPVSERCACRLVGVSRSTVRYQSRCNDDAALVERLRELARQRPRFGYRRLHALLRRDGNITLVGVPVKPLGVEAFSLIMGRRTLSGSMIGGIAETQEMLDFCGEHNITADVEVIPIQKVNEAYERLLKSDVKYRFSIDMASLRSE